MIKLLFICLGNICRSPMAEFVMKDLVEKEGLSSHFEIASCAISSEELGNPVYPPAKKILLEHGIDPLDKRAVKIKSSDYENYDYLICMDQSNLHSLMHQFSNDPQHKIHMILDFANRPKESVADPWYTGDFLSTWNDVLAGCRGLLAWLKEEGQCE